MLPVGALVMVNISSYTGAGSPSVQIVPVASAGTAVVIVKNVGTVTLDAALSYKYMIV